MDNCKLLHSLLSQIHRNNQRLQSFKVSPQQATQTFNLLNTRRKGYLDLADIYSVFPSATEEHLFFLFKSLDLSRNNRIDLQNFIAVISKKDYKTSQFYHTIKKKQHLLLKFQKFLRTMISNFQSLQQKKKSLNISSENLQNMFYQFTNQKKCNKQMDQAQETVQIDNITLFLQQEWGFSKNLALQFKSLFDQSVNSFTFNDLYRILMPISNFKSQQSIIQYRRLLEEKQRQEYKAITRLRSADQDQILKNIKAKYGIQHQQNTKINQRGIQDFENNRQKKYQISRSQNYDRHSKLSNQSQHLIMKNLSNYQGRVQQPRLHKNSAIPDGQTLNQRLLIKRMQELEPLRQNGCKVQQIIYGEQQNKFFERADNQIQRRRKQLERGSLQRKKMMDEVLNRKKQQFSGNYTDSTHQQNKFPSKVPIKDNQFNLSVQTPTQTFNKYNRANYYETQYQNTRPQSTKNSQVYAKERHFDIPYQLYHNQINRILDRNDKEGNKMNFQVEQNPVFGQISNYRTKNFSESYLKKPFCLERNNSEMVLDVYKDNFDFCRSRANYMEKYGHSLSHSTIIKQNIMKRAEEEATKKIQQIERKARMKVIERKSSAGFKWKK